MGNGIIKDQHRRNIFYSDDYRKEDINIVLQQKTK